MGREVGPGVGSSVCPGVGLAVGPWVVDGVGPGGDGVGDLVLATSGPEVDSVVGSGIGCVYLRTISRKYNPILLKYNPGKIPRKRTFRRKVQRLWQNGNKKSNNNNNNNDKSKSTFRKMEFTTYAESSNIQPLINGIILLPQHRNTPQCIKTFTLSLRQTFPY